MFDPNADPLGIGLKSRAGEYKDLWSRAAQQNAEDHGQLVSFGHIGPLSDPGMDGFFQAMREKNVTGLADSSVGMKQGRWTGNNTNGFTASPDTYNPLKPSTQMNAAPLAGFRGAMSR